ncbi:MAG: uracil-DNA glycosylase [Pseudomonadota bacterium]
MVAQVRLHDSWLNLVGEQFEAPHMTQLGSFLRAQKRAGKRIYPPGSQMFAALNATPAEHVKVVIVGQDPYHGPGQAHGLSFSVPPGIPTPPSLLNIYKELSDDLRIHFTAPQRQGCLEAWAAQGVLLLNAVLSVEHKRAASHQGKGWEQFTDAVIGAIDQHLEHVVFLLWGSYAQKKGAVVDRTRHCVLQAPHPSPLSAHRGFFGCRHFSQANAYLETHGRGTIDWSQVS